MSSSLQQSVFIVALVALFTACSPTTAPPKRDSESAPETAATFVDKVWTVKESSAVAPGTLYTFLSDGTMVVTSPHSTPSLGKWREEGETLIWVEESLPYKVDVIKLAADELRVRVHNPGEPVEIYFVPADLPTEKK